MESRRIAEIYQLLEAYRETDGTDLQAEKTAVIAELLEEMERLEREHRSVKN